MRSKRTLPQNSKNKYKPIQCVMPYKTAPGITKPLSWQVDLLRDYVSVSCLSEAGGSVLIPINAFEMGFLAEERDVFFIVLFNSKQ